MKARVEVRLKSGVLDPQGKAVEESLRHLGVEGVSDVRVGKLIEFSVNASDAEHARTAAQRVCDQLLVNAVIEKYELNIEE